MIKGIDPVLTWANSGCLMTKTGQSDSVQLVVGSAIENRVYDWWKSVQSLLPVKIEIIFPYQEFDIINCLHYMPQIKSGFANL